MELPDTSLAWLLMCAVLVLLMQPGFLCLETGLVKAKNSINTAAKNLADFAFAGLLFWLIGGMLMYGPSYYGIIGFSSVDIFHHDSTPIEDVRLLFDLLFCGTAVTLVSGALVERTRFLPFGVITLVMAALVFPVIGHWVWNPDGWLRQFGSYDFAGALVVHATGGWVALAAILVVGPRLGRFTDEFRTRHAQNFPLAALGTLLLFVGWIGFNAGAPLKLYDKTPLVVLNTIFAGGAGVTFIVAVLVIRGGKRVQVASLLNGCLAGLVAVTASAGVISHGSAVFIGAVGAAVFFYSDQLLERYRLDDGIGVISVHLTPAIWAMIAVPLFADGAFVNEHDGLISFMTAQISAVAVTGFFAFFTSFAAFWTANRFLPFRASKSDEVRGLNIAEHGVISEIDDMREKMQTQLQSLFRGDAFEVDPDSEVGQLSSVFRDAVTLFRQSTEEWKGRLAVAETSNGLLRTRTVDLEEALVAKEAELRRVIAKVDESGADLSRMVEEAKFDSTVRQRMFDELARTSAVSLRSIVSTAKSIEKHHPPTAIAAVVSSVTDRAQELANLFETLVQYLQVDKLPEIQETTPVNLSDMLRKGINARAAKTRRITFGLKLDTGGTDIAGNAALINVMCNHLLDEAIRRTENGRITVETRKEKQGLAIVIIDEGPILDDATIAALLDPFQAMRNGLAIPTKVMDFRLALARRITELHGGKLMIQSLAKHRTAVKIFFPEKSLAAHETAHPSAKAS